MTRRHITIVLPFFENQGMLVEHQRIWRTFDRKLRDCLHVIVVDDGSPTRPALPSVEPAGIASYRLYRIGVNIRWNWLACRNLGMAHATTEWVLLTDIDHALPEATLRTLVEGDVDPANVYRFSRVTAPAMQPYKPHPNTWFLTRAMFNRIGGYDERLSGCYGTDGEFRDRVNATARAIVLLPDVMIRYPREVIPDASTSPEVLTRKNDPQNDADLIQRRQVRAQIPNWRPLRLTFPAELQWTA